jgi:predicted transcriptional regulator
MQRPKGRGFNHISDIMNKISGIQTIKSIKSALNINRAKAIYLVHKLRKRGYVITKQGSDNVRVYYIATENALGGTSYIDIINRYSPIKLTSAEVYKIYGREISIEETIIYAVKTKKFRYILSALALFRKIKNWPELYRLAKKNNLVREIGVLYNLVEIILPKVKKMPKLYLAYGLPKKNEDFKYIIPVLNSADFKEIEKKWRVYLPFNKSDLMEYKL